MTVVTVYGKEECSFVSSNNVDNGVSGHLYRTGKRNIGGFGGFVLGDGHPKRLGKSLNESGTAILNRSNWLCS